MSKAASRAPQEISIDFAVLPETNCQGLFHQNKKLCNGKSVSVTELYILIYYLLVQPYL